MSEIQNPKVFISYTWTNDEYIHRVVDFANRLRSDGIEVLLDQNDLKVGNDMNDYMEKCVTDKTVTNVLILLSPDYKEKADARTGGTGIETQIISGKVYQDVGNTKFIPILFDKRDKPTKDSIPAYLSERFRLDFSDPDMFEANYVRLVRLLYGKDSFVKNPVGHKPDWVDQEEDNVSSRQIIKNIYLSAHKEFGDEKAIPLSFLQLQNNASSITKETITKQITSSAFPTEYQSFFPLRSAYLELLGQLRFDSGIGTYVHDFFEYLIKTERSIAQSSKNSMLTIFIHEIFIETIAILFLAKNLHAIFYLIYTPYLSYDSWSKKLDSFDESIYSLSKSNIYELDKELGRLLYESKEPNSQGRHYLTGIGEYWRRNIPTDFLSSDDFANADVLLTNLAISVCNSHWFPLTYIYLPNERSSWIEEIGLKLKDARTSKQYYELLNSKSKDNIITAIKKQETFMKDKNGWLGYNESFSSAPLLIDEVKPEEVESNK